MEDLAIGRLLRELRIRLGWPQRRVAASAGISRSAYSEIEHGLIGKVPLEKLRKVAGVLEVRLRLEPSWRGAGIDIVVSARHTGMAELVAQLLIDAGWDVRPEVSFNHFGERGVVDLLAWHVATRSLLLVEVKTEIADVSNLLAVADRRRRLASAIAAPFDWLPATVAQWVVVAESRTNERRLAAHRAFIRAAFPADGRAIRGWLRNPHGPIAALSFLPGSSGSSARRRAAPTQRVRDARSSVNESEKAAT